jgi:hypothetical protein
MRGQERRGGGASDYASEALLYAFARFLTQIHTHTHTHTHARAHARTHTHTHARMRTHLRSHARTHMRAACAHTLTLALSHVQMK